MQRTILHVDANCFYASCEMREHPELRNVPMIVGGDESARHGIVLAKNDLAKKYGIVTAETLWQARKKCPKLVCVPPRMRVYEEASNAMRTMFYTYTDCVEPFGLDEAWLDITHSPRNDGFTIAEEIRRRIWREIGITVSVGVSFSKVFAKLGSDMKKPDATTVIMPEDVPVKVWPLPAREMLYVGPATQKRLNQLGLYTIGDIATMPKDVMHTLLGKNGEMLHGFANGQDNGLVLGFGHSSSVQSVGNSTTTPRDLTCNLDAKLTLYTLAESVGARLREQGLEGHTLSIGVRDNGLDHFERQVRMPRSTQLTTEIAETAYTLFCRSYCWETHKPIRSLGIAMSGLAPVGAARQLSLFEEDQRHERLTTIEKALDGIRQKHGYFAVQRALMLADRSLTGLDVKGERVDAKVGFQG